MPFLPFSILRPRGIGTAASCRSRSIEIVDRVVRLCERFETFRYSIDSVWAISAYVEGGGSASVLSELHESRRLSVGASWAGVGWPTHPAAHLRDAQMGVSELRRLGMEPRSILSAPALIVTASGLSSVSADALSAETGVRFVSDDAVAQRDAEREIGSGGKTIPIGAELWCPTERLVERLLERAEDAGIDADFVTWDGAALPDNEGPAGDPDWASLLPAVHRDLCRVSGELVRTERILSMGALLGVDVPASGLVDDVWKRHLEDLAGTYTGSGDTVKRREVARSCGALEDEARRLSGWTETSIAARVDAGEGPDGILPIVVFNPTTCSVSDVVETHVVYYGENSATDFSRYEFYKLVDPEGDVVPVEEVTGKQVETAEIGIRFLAQDVPALGYRTYYLVPKPQEQPFGQAMPIQAPGAMTPDFPEPKFAIEDVEERVSTAKRGLRVGRTFTSGRVVLEIDEVTGHLRLLDREGRPLCENLRVEAREDDMSSPAGQFKPTGRVWPQVMAGADLVESGEVSALLSLRGKIGQSEADLAVRMYADLPYVDIRVSLLWTDTHPAQVEFCGAFGASFEEGVCERFFGAESWRQGDASITADRVCAVTGPPGSLVLAAERTPVHVSGRCFRSPLLLSSPDPASYAYNKVWLSHPERLTYDFRICLNAETGNDRVGSIVSGDASLRCSVVYDRSSTRHRPPSSETLRVDPTVRVLGVRPSGDGVEIALRDARGEKVGAVVCSGAIGDAGATVDFGGRAGEGVTREFEIGPHDLKNVLFPARAADTAE